MRTGPSNWISVKTTRHCPIKPDFQRDDRPLTIDDVRNPLMPWLSAGEVPDDHEDIEYAACWALSHSPVMSIGLIQAASTAPEVPRRDKRKKV
jgi:hypothetical protein